MTKSHSAGSDPTSCIHRELGVGLTYVETAWLEGEGAVRDSPPPQCAPLLPKKTLKQADCPAVTFRTLVRAFLSLFIYYILYIRFFYAVMISVDVFSTPMHLSLVYGT